LGKRTKNLRPGEETELLELKLNQAKQKPLAEEEEIEARQNLRRRRNRVRTQTKLTVQ
jgi:hypothetical protein